MPFCDVSLYQKEIEKTTESNGVKIFYRRYGHGGTKALLIIGLAGTHDSWGPQIKGLTGSVEPNDDEDSPTTIVEEMDEQEGIEICCFDNRGMGRSSVPTKKSDYTTTKMAGDALALLDHLGWKKAHVFGHSMGAMIACKLAAMASERISSLALLNATGGGFQCFPKLDRQMMSLAYRFLRAKTPEERAHVDLDTHYTKEYLDEYVGSSTRRSILYQEYVKGISSTGMQSNHGFEGQVNACWTHKMTNKEFDSIRSAGFPISVIHGRHDVIAQLYYAQKLAEKLYPAARMVELHGAHLVSHERPHEVNEALKDLMRASKSKAIAEEWSCLPEMGESVGQNYERVVVEEKAAYSHQEFFSYDKNRLANFQLNNILENKIKLKEVQQQAHHKKDELIWKYQPNDCISTKSTCYYGLVRSAKIQKLKMGRKITIPTHGNFIASLCHSVKKSADHFLNKVHNSGSKCLGGKN